jgi:hypothetical protein
MARYRDDRDDEDEDDRPRRKSRRDDGDDEDRPRRRSQGSDDPPKSNLPVILLVVGLAVGLPLLGCAGFAVWGFFQVKDAVQQEIAGDEASSAADSFFEALSRQDVNAAYQAHTTDAFKAGTSKDAFARLVKANPVLTTPHWADSGVPPKPVGQKPNRTVTLTYTVSHDEVGMEDIDPDDQPPGRPVPGRPKPPANPKANQFKTVTCTVVVAEQPNGTWKVDKFSIP